jgi:AraC-like DNA-binding protein
VAPAAESWQESYSSPTRMHPAAHAWSPTVAASNARRIVGYGVRRGVDPRMLGAALLRDIEAERPDARVPAPRMFQIWTQLGTALDRALPIQVAESFRLDDLALLGFVATTAPSVRDGLEAFMRYAGLLTDAFTWDLALERNSFEVRWQYRVPLDPGVCMALETSLAQYVQAIRELAGADVDPIRVGFRHPLPVRAAAHRAFFRCRVEFDAPRYHVVFPRHVLEAEPRQSNRVLWRYLCAQAELVKRSLAPEPLAARIRSEVARCLADGRTPRLDQLARQLGTSQRSLRRQLSADAINFRTLVDSERRERARELLANPAISITRAALELGFADPSALAHACRRWFGRAPRELRG